MSNVFNFIAVKDIQSEILLEILIDDLHDSSSLSENMYISLLRPADGLCLIEFTDFIPISRYRDIDVTDFINFLAKCFNDVYLFDKNEQTMKSRYQKYLKGNLYADITGEKALEYGLLVDFDLKFDDIAEYIQRVWDNKSLSKDKKPEAYQVIKNREIMQKPEKINYLDFYSV